MSTTAIRQSTDRSKISASLRLSQKPSVLWHCWLGVRKGIRPVKTWLMRCWRGYLLQQSANSLHMVQLMPLPPHHLLLQQNPEWFILLVPTHLGCPRKRVIKQSCNFYFLFFCVSLICGLLVEVCKVVMIHIWTPPMLAAISCEVWMFYHSANSAMVWLLLYKLR